MKVAYTTLTDSYDIRAWSGSNVYILQALVKAGLNVQTIGDLKAETTLSFLKGAYYGRIKKQTYFKVHDTDVLRGFARQVQNQLKTIDTDVIFSPKWEPIAYLKTDKPIAFWHDATVPALVGFYPGYDNTCQESISSAIKAERLALEKCRLAIYSSEWAARSAVDYYGVDPHKVVVVPFGANLVCSRTPEDILASAEQRGRDRCQLLFIGGEWDRKGGSLAVQVAQELNQRGIPAELHVIGCRPTGVLPDSVRLHGFISKETPRGRQRLDALFAQAHFLVLPTRADCTPVVFPEAASFGLPVLATDVGGIPTVIHDGKNGHKFPLAASAGDYCDYIENLWSDHAAYQALCFSSFQEYSTRLNWETSGKKVSGLLDAYYR
jgi:glycosyltransferase involved in cell wall biosynthesis